jgi:hypothetical protein
LLPPQWAYFAAGAIKTEIYSKPVLLKLTLQDAVPVQSSPNNPLMVSGPQVARYLPGLHVQFTFQSETAFSIKEARARHENLGLLAVFELNRMLGGEIDSQTTSSGKQQIDLWLPFV